jgi:hypothetical protein
MYVYIFGALDISSKSTPSREKRGKGGAPWILKDGNYEYCCGGEFGGRKGKG